MEPPHELQRPRVFVIGLSRTGTTSLCLSARSLGYLPVHNPDPAPFFTGDFSTFETFDFGGDISVAGFYRELDEAYPDSRFVLTLRDAEAWLKSVVIHFANLPVNSTGGARGMIRERIYGTEWPTPEQFLASYHRHISEVARHFQGRKNALLVLDVTQDDVWDKLCPFLGHDRPPTPFPISNATTEVATDRAMAALGAGRTNGNGAILFLP